MADYGHELILGTLISPQNQRPHEVVGLARLTERAGLDLVTFQDHPYQPRYLDAWTLLSYVAAQTERVRLSGNVIDLRSRPPAVLARAAASLDLLSAGRDPREIRRLANIAGTLTAESRGFLHGAPKQWVEELLPLVLEQGFTAFILTDDDPRAIVVWGAEVAPALRDAVARERSIAGL
jgi:Luciferase-like monooxygenase